MSNAFSFRTSYSTWSLGEQPSSALFSRAVGSVTVELLGRHKNWDVLLLVPSKLTYLTSVDCPSPGLQS